MMNCADDSGNINQSTKQIGKGKKHIIIIKVVETKKNAAHKQTNKLCIEEVSIFWIITFSGHRFVHSISKRMRNAEEKKEIKCK